MFNVYVNGYLQHLDGHAPVLAKTFGDLKTSLDYALRMQKKWHIVKLVHKDTNRTLYSTRSGNEEINGLKDFLNPPPKPIPDVCNCDFSRGNFSCTCGAGRREIEASKRLQEPPELLTNPCEELPLDDVPF